MAMAVTLNASAFVNAKAASIGLSQIVGTTASSGNPAYLVLTALDRNEYTAGASGATGSFSGNGQVLKLSSIGGDGRAAGIIFTYIASSGRYYNSIYGYLDQLTYNASASLDDVTNLSFFGTSSLGLATDYANNAYALMQTDAPGYIGSATVVTEQSFAGAVPSQATPDSIIAAADSFVGKAWNMDGCWVLASTIAAEAGASLPVQSTAIGVPGQANGEWFVAYNGPAGGQSGNWQSMVTAGEIIVIGTSGGGGHITTCVSGSGASAMLVDNITYENYQGQIVNPANDGSASDVLVAAPHAASQEWSGVAASSVVIYELDTPDVTAAVSSDYLFGNSSQSLGSLFSAIDPAGKSITEWQVYDTAGEDSFAFNGGRGQAHSAASAVTSASLSAVSLLTGSVAVTDTLEVRAFNGSYWGDWASLAVTVSAAAQPPVLNAQTGAQTWVAGQSISLALAPNAFTDPQNESLSYKAALASGAALPGWLIFDPATETFAGTAPTNDQTLSIVVTATDSSGLSASETISASVISPPKLGVQTANQVWDQGQSISLALPAGAFTDPQGGSLTYKATLLGGQALPNWLTFNAATQTFSGGATAVAQTLNIVVTATDSFGLSASETFSATVIAAPKVAAATPGQTWAEGKPVSLTLPGGTFIDPQGEKLSYAATQWDGSALPGWLVFNAATGTFSGTAPASAQTVNILVTATNSSGLWVSEQFTAAIVPPPVVSAATAAQTWLAGQAMTLALPAGTFTDPRGQKLTYSANLANGQALPAWLTFNAATETFSGTAPAAAQTLGILVTATDSSGLSVSETFSATVIGAPVLTVATPGQTWVEGKAISLVLPGGAFADAQGEKLSYKAALASGQALPNWLTFNAATGTFTGTAPSSFQTLSIVVTATNSSGLSASETISATVAAPPVVAAATPGQAWNAGQTISLTLPGGAFADPQGEKLTYKAALANGQALPTWLTFNALTDSFSGTAPASAQTLSIAVTATDSSGLSISETIAATVIGAPNVAIPTPGQAWVEGKAISLALPGATFADPQGEKLTCKASLASGQALPGWLIFNAATQTFTGTAPLTYQTLSILVTATNSSGLSASETIAVAVAGAPKLAVPTPAQTWNAGQPISLTLPGGTFTDPQGETLTYKAALANGQSLPAWLTFNAATETFTGTAPQGAQTQSIVVTATDSSGLSASETISATIIGAPVLEVATPGQTWKAGQAVSFALPAGTFADPQGEKLTYKAALASGQALPGWLTFNPATATFTGTAPAGAQSLGIVVTVTDSSGLFVSETISATVIGAPVLTAATPGQTWVEGKAVSLALPAGTFADPQGEKLTYKAALASGQALPGWLNFNAATETFSGTAPSSYQSLSIVVTATNSGGVSASETISATVAAPPRVAAATPNQTWTEGKAISLALPNNAFSDPQGEALSYKATLSNGQALPGWLTFNAAAKAFSGTAPATAQSLVITVTATDSSGLSGSESFTASVQAAASTAAKGMIVSVQPASEIAAVVPASSILASSAGTMGFLGGDTAVSAAAGSFGAGVPAPGGIISFTALATGGGVMAPGELFSVPSAGSWLQAASGIEAAAFGAALFDPPQNPGLPALHG
jgi:hypothetical protein